MSLPEILRSWLDHRHEVLVRRSKHQLAAIERRGYSPESLRQLALARCRPHLQYADEQVALKAMAPPAK